MTRPSTVVAVAVAAAAAAWTIAVRVHGGGSASRLPPLASHTAATPVAAARHLRAHADQWQSGGRVVNVTSSADGWPRVYVAEGFGLANSIMLETPDGVTVVDTTESVAVASAVKAAFLPLARGKPLLGVVYTHFHSDHVNGAGAFVDFNRDADAPLPVYSHALTEAGLRNVMSTTNVITYKVGSHTPPPLL